MSAFASPKAEPRRCPAPQYSIPRENLVIMTKAFFLVSPDPSVRTMLNPGLGNTREFVNQGGLSRGALFNQVDVSLERLGMSYIDVLQVHMFDPSTPLAETMKALHDLVQSGKVRYLGACNMRAWQFAEMQRVAEVNGWTLFVSMQVEYSLLYRPAVRHHFYSQRYADHLNPMPPA